jgi:hypothetical protein
MILCRHSERIMDTEPRPRAVRKRFIIALRILFAAAGIVSVSLGTAGILGLIVIDGLVAVGMIVLGAAWLFGAIYRADVLEFVT